MGSFIGLRMEGSCFQNASPVLFNLKRLIQRLLLPVMGRGVFQKLGNVPQF